MTHIDPSNPLRNVKNVLIVEDELIVAMINETLIRRLGYKVISTIDNGKKAIEIARNTPIDVILMDFYLNGGFTGLDTARAIRAFSNTPILFVTASQDDALIDAVASISNTSIIHKPIREQTLKEKINALNEMVAL